MLAAALFWLVLALPYRPGGVTLGLPLELPVILLVLIATGGRRVQVPVRVIATAALTLLAVLKCADMMMVQALGRPFNPVADLPLLDASVRVIAGSFGKLTAGLAMLLAVVLPVVLALLLWRAARIWQRVEVQGRWPGAIAAMVVAALAGHAVAATDGSPLRSGTEATRFAAAKVMLARQTISDLTRFRQAAADDALADSRGLMGAINRDVLVIFVESYGRASFDVPRYANTHLPTLRRAEQDLSRAGLATRSGYLTSPTQGGQSWLAHATFANGLWVNDQSRYLAALASGRQTLFHHAQRAGFRTAAVMPAITMPWPESQRMGFDRVLAAADLGYRGKPFNWVTMPDQFTLSAADRLLRDSANPKPLFAQIVLISSHAPWVPVPSLVDWADLGDGRIFDGMAEAGDKPAEVWRDRNLVQDHYRDAVDYVLQTLAEYAAIHADTAPLMIVLGDHQAAPGIALDDRRQVPLHIIGPESLVTRTAPWGLTPGMIPQGDAQPIPMEQMRDLILRTFSDPPAEAPV